MDGAPTDVNLFSLIRPAGILPALLVFVTTYVLVRVASGGIERISAQFTEFRLALQQVKAIVRLVLALSGLGLGISLVVSLTDETLLAFAGTIAVAVGISLRDLVSSIIAGVTILIDRPFQVGDRITYGDVYGEVIEIGLRTVRVVTLDDSVVTIPNNKFLTDVVVSGNAGALDMLVQMDFFIGLGEDLAAAKALVGEVLATSRFTYLRKPWNVVVSQVPFGGALALRLRAKVYVLDVHYEKALETDVTERTMAAFGAAGIAPPALALDPRGLVAARGPDGSESLPPRR
ncbi:MAG: mechanosensitive ion channel domain-containing protein [Myxococcota bacterium]